MCQQSHRHVRDDRLVMITADRVPEPDDTARASIGEP